MVYRPDSSSTRSDKSSSSTRSSMKSNGTKNSFIRSKSGNDYNDKNAAQNKLRNSSSLQSINKTSGNQSMRGMRKFKSNGRSVCLIKNNYQQMARHLLFPVDIIRQIKSSIELLCEQSIRSAISYLFMKRFVSGIDSIEIDCAVHKSFLTSNVV